MKKYNSDTVQNVEKVTSNLILYKSNLISQLLNNLLYKLQSMKFPLWNCQMMQMI